jgi:hypothetical protein
MYSTTLVNSMKKNDRKAVSEVTLRRFTAESPLQGFSDELLQYAVMKRRKVGFGYSEIPD